MIIIGQKIDLNMLAKDIGVDAEYLVPLFDVLRRECDRLFPLLEEAIAAQNFPVLHERTHAFKGIIGNMRFDDLHKIITEMDDAAKTDDKEYPYAQTLQLLKTELTRVLDSLSTLKA